MLILWHLSTFLHYCELDLIFESISSNLTAALSMEARSHSQTIITRQPAVFNCSTAAASRATFLLNFSIQNSVLDLGVVATLQPSCRCQKQPCTKMTVRYFVRTMSGFPGR